MRQDKQLLQQKRIPWPCLFKNNFNDDFIRRNNSRLTRTTEINDTATPTLTATIPYIKNMSDNISRILQPFNIYVVHKPITTLRQLPTNVKDKDEPKNRRGAVRSITPTAKPPSSERLAETKSPNSSCLKKLREQAVCWFPVPLGLSWSFQLRLVENFQTNEGGQAVNGFILSDLGRIYSLTLTWKT